MIGRILGMGLWLLLLSRAAMAFEWLPPNQNVYIFGGQFTRGTVSTSLLPFYAPSDHHYVAGAAYNREFANLGWNFIAGAEIGAGGRFGSESSAEIWGGMTLRYRGFSFAGVSLVPGVTVGLSGVTDPIGIEIERERARNGNASLLFYLGPELALGLASVPNLEFVYRLHHRSGLQGTLGHMGEGYNANTFGLRIHF